MPIHPPLGLRCLDDRIFKQVTFEVMDEVFKLHNSIGCLFDEAIYKRALVRRLQAARAEVPLELRFRDFAKTLYLDLLVADGALFEFKAAERIHQRHRAQAQLLNYLYLLELPHGKLINVRPGTVEHEFVNATIPRAERISFEVDDSSYTETAGLRHSLLDLCTDILRDWGTCLDVLLYEEAFTHFLGGPQRLVQPVEIRIGDATVGTQKLNLLTGDTSFHITTIASGLDHYRQQLRRFLDHVALHTIQWVNVGRKLVTYRTITRNK